MFETTRKQISGYKEMSICYSTYSKKEGSNCLAIMFPGVGYTVHGPLFHFATGFSLNKGIDVLHLEYPYGDSSYDHFTMDQLSEAVIYDSETIIDQVLEDRNYEEFYLIGKSFGTIAMSNEVKKARFKDAKAVWLTPLLKRDDVFTAMMESTAKGLCLIGTHDSHYDQDRFKQMMTNRNIVAKLYPEVNHSMEIDGDIIKSIDVLKDVIQILQQL